MINKIWNILNKKQQRSFVLACIIIMVGSAVELLGVALIAPVVSIATDETKLNEPVYIKIGEVFNLNTLSEYIVFLIVVIIVIYFLKNMYILFQNYYQNRFTYNIQRQITTELMRFYMRKEYLYHVSTNIADIQRNIISDVNVSFDVLMNIFYVANESLICILLVVYLALQDWITIVSMASILGMFIILFVFIYKKYSVRLGEQARIASAAQNKWVLQGFAGIKEIKVAGKEDFFADNYDNASYKTANLQIKKAFINVMPKPIMELACVGGLLSVIGLRVYWGENVKELIPILSMFVVAAFRMLPSFNRVTQYMGTIMYGKPSVESVYNDIQELRKKASEFYRIENDEFDFKMATDIIISNISFKYPEGEKNVIENVSFTVPHLKSTAFVGPSGAGKSTMADIILGILLPQQGSVESDGVNVFEHIRQWHNKVGYIPQVIYLTDDTIKNNVAFGLNDDEISEDRVWEAIKEAQLDEFVNSLPEGINTIVGDRGVKLSGGQRQRIGIARALYRNPDFLILDEATSALDNDTEKAVMEAIDNLHGKRTMIIIAHRLTTIENCDVVYKISDGKVIKTK